MNSYQNIIKNLAFHAYKRGINYDLSQLKLFLSKLGHPEKKLKNIIHIAGTNGKGSVLTYIVSLLKNAGYTVGAYISPHIEDYRERIRINNKLITQKEFIDIYKNISQVTGFSNLTEFEILTSMAFIFFAQKTPDFICLETGLGGKLDATNVVNPLVSVITSISLDHQGILGDSLAKITKEKAGIIKPSIPVFTSNHHLDILKVIQRQAKSVKSPVFHVKHLNVEPQGKLKADYQKENLNLAIAVINYLQDNKIINITPKQIQKGIKTAFIWGRYQKITYNHQTIIIDGAHNPSAIHAVINNIQKEKQLFPLDIWLGILKIKDAKNMLNILSSIANQIYYSQFNEQAYSFQEISSFNRHLKLINWDIDLGIPDSKSLLITGSFYFLGKIKHLLSLKRQD